jgi:hypothetical protein
MMMVHAFDALVRDEYDRGANTDGPKLLDACYWLSEDLKKVSTEVHDAVLNDDEW